MSKRYVYNVTFRGKIIDKISIVANEEDIALEEANSMALDVLDVQLEEIIEEE